MAIEPHATATLSRSLPTVTSHFSVLYVQDLMPVYTPLRTAVSPHPGPAPPEGSGCGPPALIKGTGNLRGNLSADHLAHHSGTVRARLVVLGRIEVTHPSPPGPRTGPAPPGGGGAGAEEALWEIYQGQPVRYYNN